ncbi:MAG: tetratricopeptide repeat protein [Sodaliphilus sp.]
MTLEVITKHKKSIWHLLDARRIYEAIIELSPIVEEVADYHLTEHFNQVKMSYDYMIQYFLAGVNDEGRESMLHHITDSLYTITDRCVIELSIGQSFEWFYTKISVLRKRTLQSMVLYYLDYQNRFNLLCSVPAESQNRSAISSIKRDLENTAVDIFNKVWCTFPFSGEDVQSCKQLLDAAPEYVNQLMMAALFLGQTKFYDEAKLVLMMEVYLSASDIKTQTRALAGVVMTMLLHPNRIHCSSRLSSLMANLAEVPHFQADVNSIVQRLVMARNTERLSKRMREELMPNIKNMNPDLLSKLRTNPQLDPSELEENPQWQKWFEENGVSNKLEEINKLQSEGEDVFIYTFSKLKSFPFFNTLANWFLPFYPSHSMCEDALGANKQLVSMLKIAPFLCDSDKYSFCFSIASMPNYQMEMMANQLDVHSRDLKELESAQLLSSDTHQRDAAINAYIQSLYRFFTLFSRRNDFVSVFKTSMDFTCQPLFSWLNLSQSALLMIAEYFLKNHFYADAVTYFEFVQNHFSDVSPQVLQKMGFAYHNMGHYDKALYYYLRYEIVDDADLWNMRHIASCYRAQQQYDKALAYYEKLLTVKKNNVALCLTAGHCLLKMNRIEDAMNHYFKASYLDAQNPKVWRALAWTYFLLNKYEQSADYYNKLVQSGASSTDDHLNYGHLLLSLGKMADAVSEYAISANADINSFITAFDADFSTLSEHGVTSEVAQLVKDAVVKKIHNT